MIRGPANLTDGLKRMAHQQMGRVHGAEQHMAGGDSDQATAVK